jgi:hypothetical protein
MLIALVPIIPGFAAEDDKPWPFYVPQVVEPPTVQDADWVRNNIDAFILAKLEDKELQPAPEASKQTLIRRLYFDLIGLPPTPEEVAAFSNDADPQAYENLVDRLLKDPRHGERWARLWLDLARYADTAGYEGDPDLPHAWRYRDYVIDAFNSDKPYDVFIKEQIAGDEFEEIMGAGDLPGTPPERVVAMTFLRLAPFTEPRGDETRHELLSEMTSTVGSVFLGLTVGCAKCHDHKHDSIPTRDFYRMQAFFATVSLPRPEPGDGFQIGGPLPAKFYRPGETEWAAKQTAHFEQELVDSKKELRELTARLEKRLGSQAGFGLQALGGPLGNNYIFDQTKVNDDKLHVAVVNCDGKQWDYFTDGHGPNGTGGLSGSNQGQWFGDLPNPKHAALGQYSEGTGGPKGAFHVGRFAEILIYDRPLDASQRLAVQSYVDGKYYGEDESPGDLPKDGLRFWLDAGDLDADPETENQANGETITSWTDRITGTTLSQADAGLQPKLSILGKTEQPAVLFDNDFLVGDLQKAAFVEDQQGAMVVIYSASHSHEGYGFEIGGEGSFVSTFINPTAATKNIVQTAINDENNELVSPEERERYRHLSSRERFVPQYLKRLKPVAMSLRHSYGPPYEPGVPTSRVMIRGEYDNPGEVVEPGFPTCIEGEERPAKIRLDPFKRWPTRSRRMTLAEWIASPDNPLTARVMVNRLWHWHFGRGIVATPSDFGTLSGGPSHPELLDWLATRFVQEKWSIKAMHRLIVTSQTYRQASAHQDERAEEMDPDDKLLWRFSQRRLEAEAVRDSVLAVSGRLNSEQFGLPIFPTLPDGIEERVKYTNTKWDTQRGEEGRKRSLYIYQQRTLTMPLMQAFDSLVCEESRPRRRTSVTPLQALALYNGAFVNEEASHFANRVREKAGDDPRQQIARAFLLALSRKPTDVEAEKMLEFLNTHELPERALVGLCRILYNSNEFVYVD